MAASRAMRALYARWVAWVERVATPDRMRAYARLMAIAMAGGMAWNYARGSGLFDASGNLIGGDFLAFYTGARLFLAGRLADAYDPGTEFTFPAQLEFQRALLAPHAITGANAFVNPPHAALLYLPFAWPRYAGAIALWWAAGLAALALAIELLRRELARERAISAARAWAACGLFLPTYAWFGYGQATTWIALFTVGFFVLLRQGRDGLAGACLAFLAFKPQLAVAPALVLLVCGRWRAIAAGAVGGAAWLALGAALAPGALAAYAALAPQLGAMLRFEGYATNGIQSFLGFAALLFDAFSPRAADALATVLALGSLTWIAALWWRTPWRPGSPEWDQKLAAALAIGWIASPHLYLYDLMLLLIPFAIVFSHARKSPPLGGGPVLAWSCAVWLLSFLGTPLTRVQLFATGALGVGPFAIQLATLAIAAWAIEIARRGDEAAAHP